MFEDILKLSIDQVYGTDPHVYAYECPQCARLHYPAVIICKKCGYRRYPEDEHELIWQKRGYKSWKKILVEGACSLLTYTRLWALPMDFDDRYLDFAVVQFEKLSISAPGMLWVEAPRAGMPLQARVECLREIRGESFYGLVFEESK